MGCFVRAHVPAALPGHSPDDSDRSALRRTHVARGFAGPEAQHELSDLADLARPYWRAFRIPAEDRLSSARAYDVGLVVDGKITYRMPSEDAQGLPSGDRHAYAVWTRLDGSWFKNKKPIAEEGGSRILALRSGRVAVYTRHPSWDPTFGLQRPTTHRVVLAKFRMTEEHVRVNMLGSLDMLSRSTWPADESSLVPRHIDGELDARWWPIIERARRGFNEYCRELTDEMQRAVDYRTARLPDPWVWTTASA